MVLWAQESTAQFPDPCGEILATQGRPSNRAQRFGRGNCSSNLCRTVAKSIFEHARKIVQPGKSEGLCDVGNLLPICMIEQCVASPVQALSQNVFLDAARLFKDPVQGSSRHAQE